MPITLVNTRIARIYTFFCTYRAAFDDRNMVKKYHPDRVAHLGPEHQKGAEEKFKQVQEAYEYLQKERGF